PDLRTLGPLDALLDDDLLHVRDVRRELREIVAVRRVHLLERMMDSALGVDAHRAPRSGPGRAITFRRARYLADFAGSQRRRGAPAQRRRGEPLPPRRTRRRRVERPAAGRVVGVRPAAQPAPRQTQRWALR